MPTNEPIIIKHAASGASATIHPFGATITSFLNSSGHETLFVSSLAKTDGSKATRGGIPLVFPQFGQPHKDMPQHGFLRNNYWTLGKVYDDENEAGCEFALNLKDVVNARGEGIWKKNDENDSNNEEEVDCTIVLSMKVAANSLTTTLAINNAGSASFDYQTLFHTYFKIYGSKALDQDLCHVTGLAGYSVLDTVTHETTVQGDEPVCVDREVDCVFSPSNPEEKPAIDLVVKTGEGGKTVSVQASASVDGEVVPVSVVVWNPFVEKSKGMSDFDNEEYHDMLCVEPGILGAGVKVMEKLNAGKTVEFRQKITTL